MEAEPTPQADPAGDDKKWQATRETFVAGDGSAQPWVIWGLPIFRIGSWYYLAWCSAGGFATKDVLEATKGVDVDARKEALQIAVCKTIRCRSLMKMMLHFLSSFPKIFQVGRIICVCLGVERRNGPRKQGAGRQIGSAQGSAFRSPHIHQGSDLYLFIFWYERFDMLKLFTLHRRLKRSSMLGWTHVCRFLFDLTTFLANQLTLKPLQSILSYKIGSEDGDASGANQSWCFM